MRPLYLWIAASCILALFGMLPVFSSGTPPAGREKVIYSFTGSLDGAIPTSDLTLDAAGNLYGTTEYGGGTGNGIVFELKRAQDGWKEHVLYSFTGGTDSYEPQAGVIFDKSGNLYGTTQGTVFKLTPNSRGGWTESVIYTFDCYGAVGCASRADLIFDTQGSLYGTTESGGDQNACDGLGCGAVFKLTPQTDGSWTETTLHAFTDTDGDGATPSSGVALDSKGNVYGTTASGGSGRCQSVYGLSFILGCGTIYTLTSSGGTWTETVLYSFVAGSGYGIYPSSQVVFDNPDHLLGLTKAGGDGLGTFFELKNTAKGWQRDNAHIFFGPPGDGYQPTGRLIANSNGDILGVTYYGGASGKGSVFEFERLNDGWKEKILYSFGGRPDGMGPSAGLVLDSQGALYGTTSQGGTSTGNACNYYGCGVVYQLTP